MLPTQCKAEHRSYPGSLKRWINIKKVYQERYVIVLGRNGEPSSVIQSGRCGVHWAEVLSFLEQTESPWRFVEAGGSHVSHGPLVVQCSAPTPPGHPLRSGRTASPHGRTVEPVRRLHFRIGLATCRACGVLGVFYTRAMVLRSPAPASRVPCGACHVVVVRRLKVANSLGQGAARARFGRQHHLAPKTSSPRRVQGRSGSRELPASRQADRRPAGGFRWLLRSAGRQTVVGGPSTRPTLLNKAVFQELQGPDHAWHVPVHIWHPPDVARAPHHQNRAEHGLGPSFSRRGGGVGAVRARWEAVVPRSAGVKCAVRRSRFLPTAICSRAPPPRACPGAQQAPPPPPPPAVGSGGSVSPPSRPGPGPVSKSRTRSRSRPRVRWLSPSLAMCRARSPGPSRSPSSLASLPKRPHPRPRAPCRCLAPPRSRPPPPLQGSGWGVLWVGPGLRARDDVGLRFRLPLVLVRFGAISQVWPCSRNGRDVAAAGPSPDRAPPPRH